MTDYESLANQLLSELTDSLRSVDSESFDSLKRAVVQARQIFVAGKGRSGLQMRAFAMRLMHLGLQVYVVDDVTTPAIGAGDLLVIGSGSGRTASLVSYANRANELKAQVAVITIDPTSPVARAAELVMRIAASSPKLDDARRDGSSQPLGSLFEQTLGLVLDLLIADLMVELNISSDQMFARHANLE
jgi:6-phospho-3-hexuloisomerase